MKFLEKPCRSIQFDRSHVVSAQTLKINEWRISLWWLANVVTLSLPGTPSSPVWYPIIPCLEPYLHLVYGHLHLAYHHLHLVYHHLSGTPPSMSGIPPESGIPLLDWNPIPVWNPTMCLESHPIPCLVSHPSAPHHLAHSTSPPSDHYCSYLASNCPLAPDLFPACPPSWTPAPCHPHYPQQLSSGPHAPSYTSLLAIWASLPTAPAPSGLLLSASCPTTPTNCHLALLSPAIPSIPCHLALLTPNPCLIWLPAVAPPASTTPTPIWNSCPHPTKYHHQRSPPPKKEIWVFLSFQVFWCSFQSHLMWV